MSRTLSILGYHKIGPPSPTAWETWFYVPLATFERQMRQLRDGGWNVIDAAMLLRALAASAELPEKAVLLTFDDGYRSVLRHALPVLQQFNFKAIVFVPTAAVGRDNYWDTNTREGVEPICTWDELRALESAGMSVQSHAVTHRTFGELSVPEIDREVRESKQAIERELRKPVELLAYPFDDAGKYPDSTDAALHRAGYRAAFHFVGGAAPWPAENRFHFTRIPVWPDSDLTSL
jgi:peptidoglycan/xylan/chitin deacetylase (PgdA/CDA1 family)